MSGKVYGLSKKAMTEKYEDLVFTRLMAVYAEDESARILAEIEKENITANASGIKKIFDREERKENLAVLWKYSKKVINFVAMVVFVAIVSLSSVVVASADVREAVAEAIYHLVLRETDRYTEVSIGNSSGFIDPEIYDWEGAYAPTYIPNGFSFGEMQDLDSQKIVTYFSETNFISFVQAQNVIQQADTENADRIEQIIINNSEGLLVVKGELTSLTWNIGDTLFTVLGNYYTEELINMAQSIKPINKTEEPKPEEEYTFVDPEIYTWNRGYGLTYVTEGYSLYSAKDAFLSIAINYKKGENYIAFAQHFEGGGNLHLDTEDADITKDIQIGESKGLLVIKDDWSCVLWSIEDVLIQVSGTAPTEEIIRIAKGVKPLEKSATEEYEFVDPEIYVWEEGFGLTYVPKDFTLYNSKDLELSRIINYKKGEYYISFVQYLDGSGSVNTDTENADLVETIRIGESEAFHVIKNDRSCVLWSIEDVLIQVSGTAPTEEIIRIAEGVKPINKTEEPEPKEEYTFVDPEIYDWEGAYAPTYIPKGFVFYQKQKFGSQFFVDYMRGDEYISFLQAGDVIFQVDTEDAEINKKIVIGESEGLLVSENGNTYLNWCIGNTNFQIYGTCEIDEIIKIAEGVKPIN